MVGDVVGRPGRRAVSALLPRLREEHRIELVVANGENAAGGIGITPVTAQELLQSGVDIITTGNHVWHHREIIPYLETQPEPRIVRPLNLPPEVPGSGYIVKDNVMVVNLLGRVFMGHYDCPFRAMDRLLEECAQRPPVVLVDFHAEATAEKMALGWYLDGRVSAVLGTHTHVGTIDARILNKGTAFVSDVGMAGASESVIGDDISSVIDRFLTMMPHRLSAGRGKPILNSVLLDIEIDTGRATSISRLDLDLVE